MPWLGKPDFFNPDPLGLPVVGMAGDIHDHDSTAHSHHMGQLMFVAHGCIRLAIGEADWFCMLPPTRATWIPTEVKHRARMGRPVGYRSIWFDPASFPGLPDRVRVITVSPLLSAALERMAFAPLDTPWQEGKWSHLAAVAASEIVDADDEPMLLPLPKDRRLAPLLDKLSELPPTLDELAPRIGASLRTIGRIFRRETGMSYQQWRQQWRLIRAVEMLATNHRQGDVANALAFASDSALSISSSR
jgi:AraC-like DNA-binding protein